MDYIKKIEDWILCGDLESAMNCIAAMPPTDREHYQIQNLTGIIYFYCNRPEDAVHYFQQALTQCPDDTDTILNLANAYLSLQKYQLAENLLLRCEKSNPTPDMQANINALWEELHAHTPYGTGNDKNVLMFAYYFPPLAGSGVFRSLKYAKYLHKFGWKPTVISTDQPPLTWNFRDETLVKEIPSDVNVVQIPDFYSTGRQTSMSMDYVSGLLRFLHDIFRYHTDAYSLFCSMLNSEDAIKQLITFPCQTLSWAYDTIQYIEKNMDLSKYQMIYTTSGPSSPHLIGFYLKEKYGIPWVADYRDPWTDNPYIHYDYSNPMHVLRFFLELILLQHADCNITIEDSFIQTYMDHFQLPKDKIVCITNGFDEADFSYLHKFVNPHTPKFTICYSGLLYLKERSVSPVLKSLKELIEEGKLNLDEVLFRVVGGMDQMNINAMKEYGLECIMQNTGYCSHEQALMANLQSDLLLLLVGDEPKFKPFHNGKLFDYLRSGKTILALAPPDGAAATVLRETGHGVTFLSSEYSKIKDYIYEEYQNWKNRKTDTFHHSPLIEKYERKVLTEELAKVFEAILTRPAKQQEFSSSVYNSTYKTGGAAQSYHKHYTQSFYYNSWLHAMSYLYLLDRKTSILEIGCGVGQFANLLFDHGFRNYKGFDYAEEGIFRAKENNPEHSDKFFVADAFESDLVTAKYDLIICFEVLEHLKEDIKLLQRIRPGTRLLLSVPNFHDTYHVRYFRSKEEIYTRYQSVMKIFDIQTVILNHPNTLYYIAAEKL